MRRPQLGGRLPRASHPHDRAAARAHGQRGADGGVQRGRATARLPRIVVGEHDGGPRPIGRAQQPTAARAGSDGVEAGGHGALRPGAARVVTPRLHDEARVRTRGRDPQRAPGLRAGLPVAREQRADGGGLPGAVVAVRAPRAEQQLAEPVRAGDGRVEPALEARRRRVEQPQVAEQRALEAHGDADPRHGREPPVGGDAHRPLRRVDALGEDPVGHVAGRRAAQDRGAARRVDLVEMRAVGERAELRVVKADRRAELGGERIDEGLDVAHAAQARVRR